MVAIYFYYLCCSFLPIVHTEHLTSTTEPLIHIYTPNDFVLESKCAQNVLNEVTSRLSIMAWISKFKSSKRSVSTLAYCSCLSLLLSSGDVERNPGPTQARNDTMVNSNKVLRICHLNIRSLINKMEEIKIFWQDYKPHIICLNETWLDSSITDGEIWIDGYSIHWRDRSRNGGGVPVYVNSSINCMEADGLQHDDIEALWLKISQPKSKRFYLCSCYRPPRSTNKTIYFDGLRDMPSSVGNGQEEVVVTGDLNFDCNRGPRSTSTIRLLQLMEEFNLKQLITNNFTRITEHSQSLIDLFFTSKPSLYITKVIHVGFSDHSAVLAIRKLHRFRASSPRTVQTRNYKQYIIPMLLLRIWAKSLCH